MDHIQEHQGEDMKLEDILKEGVGYGLVDPIGCGRWLVRRSSIVGCFDPTVVPTLEVGVVRLGGHGIDRTVQEAGIRVDHLAEADCIES